MLVKSGMRIRLGPQPAPLLAFVRVNQRLEQCETIVALGGAIVEDMRQEGEDADLIARLLIRFCQK